MSVIFQDIFNQAVDESEERGGIERETAEYVLSGVQDLIVQRIKDVVNAEAERFNVKHATPQVMWMRAGIMLAGRLFDGSYER